MTREEAREELITFIGTFECPSLEALEVAIEALQTDIVRCKECEHGIAETGSRFPFEGNITCELDHVKRQWFKEDFCSYGERGESYGERKE